MKPNYTARDAWEAFRDRRYDMACHIWITLMSESLSLDNQRNYQLNYTHVLVAQGRFYEATAILQELHESDPRPIYLHQLAFVAREAGDLAKSREYLLDEKGLIRADQHLLLAGNEYELGIVGWLEGEIDNAIGHARKALAHAQQSDDRSAEGCVHRLLGDLLQQKGEQDGAMDNYHAAHRAFTLVGDTLAAKEIGRYLSRLLGDGQPPFNPASG